MSSSPLVAGSPPLSFRSAAPSWLVGGSLAAVVVFLLLGQSVVGANFTVGPKPDSGSGDGSIFRQIAYVATLAMAIVAVRPIKHPARLMVVPLSIVFVLFWCAASMGWSLNPSVSFRRLVLAGVVIGTMFIGVRQAGYASSVRAARWIMVATLILSYLYVFIFPLIGVHTTSEASDPALIGAWRGMLRQKNFAGAACAITILLFVFDAKEMSRVYRGVVLLATVYFLYRTQSKTSMGIVAVAIAAGAAYRLYNPEYRMLLVPVGIIAVLALALGLYIEWDTLLTPLNDPAAFTGRAEIWPPLLAFARDHPFTGAGYGAFWNIGDGAGPIFHYAKGWVTKQASGHNGYLDLVVQIGIPGMLLTVFALLISPLLRVLASRTMPGPRGSLIIALIVFSAGHNSTESSLMDRDMFVFMFLLLAVALIPVAAATPLLVRPRHG